ncbi:MAG: OmpH family outer membrane protein [Pseudomonadota bacterium]
MLRSLAGAVWLAVTLATTLPAWAQEATGLPRTQVLTIDSSRLYPGTLLGQAFIQVTQEEQRRHAQGNQALAAELRAEELALTELRETLPREDFARLAEEFDTRVEAARRERDELLTDITTRAEQQERAFLQQVRPILGQIMAEAGAVVLMEAQSVVLAASAIDITDLAITRINEATQPIAPLDDVPLEDDADTDTDTDTDADAGDSEPNPPAE